MEKSTGVWYLAYGSNMSRAKFIDSRGIKPIKTARALVPGWTLTTEIPGTPYTEPAYTSIRPITGVDVKAREVVGVAYLITAEQYIHLVASEGGGIAYADIAIPAVPVGAEDEAMTGPTFTVRTLGTILRRDPPAFPSQRYMGLLTDGAADAHLPDDYQQFLQNLPVYEPPRNLMRKIGAYLFLAFWGPVMYLVEKMTMASLRPDGNAPAGTAQVVRFVVYLMWSYHDCIHAPIWGRGDGMDG
ncbi:gliotoxin biosynthesis protein [Diplodia corticola]|uniref:gamma-glutamylcyclotransferase n=1 Tax=Diplodia corticola TaxID=236234 RepID=A0A1J9REI0_9PEZI|nr:gliotoxin biosynthesis protein [Diplodia corticola]OJD30971.1 gliotoxin biosynthesis protein [Diplodia corticola]